MQSPLLSKLLIRELDPDTYVSTKRNPPATYRTYPNYRLSLQVRSIDYQAGLPDCNAYYLSIYLFIHVCQIQQLQAKNADMVSHMYELTGTKACIVLRDVGMMVSGGPL